MPLLIKFIDAIAREKKRDALFVVFGPEADNLTVDGRIDNETGSYDWKEDLLRNDLIAWLGANQISWAPCGHFASESAMTSYSGSIYIDLAFDPSDVTYQKLAAHLEYEDETIKIPGVCFCYMPLATAMQNAHHDEPDFWKKWAETF